jgi:hypothetical protein
VKLKTIANGNKMCFVCSQVIDRSLDKTYMIGIEKPYKNIFMHRPQCIAIMDQIGWREYLLKHYNEILEYDEHPVKIRKSKVEESEEEEIGEG